MDVVATLRALFEQVQTINPEPMPQAGLSRAEIDRLFGSVGLSAPPALAALYEWHNGIFHLNAFLHFIPLEEAVATYRSCHEASEYSPSLGWKPTWFPVLDINGDIQLCIDVSSGAVYSIDLIDAKSKLIAHHYFAYVNGVAELFELKAYQYNGNSGAIEPIGSAWQELARKHDFSPTW